MSSWLRPPTPAKSARSAAPRQLAAGTPHIGTWPEVAPPEETGQTFEENARQKAVYYAASTDELTVAEDSGLAIDALAGAPGVESARFGGVDASYPEKFALIYAALRSRGASTSPARFVCALALADSGRSSPKPGKRSKGNSLRRREGKRWLRSRPDLLLPAVRPDAGRSGRRQGRGQPSRSSFCRIARVSESRNHSRSFSPRSNDGLIPDATCGGVAVSVQLSAFSSQRSAGLSC